MKPLIYTLAGLAVAVALAAGPAAAQGREQQGGGASAGASAGARVAGGGDGGASRAGSSGPSGSPAPSSAGSSGGGAYSGPPAGWSGPSSSGSSGSPGVSGRSGSPYSGGAGRVNPANGNSSYVREIYGSPGDRAVPRGSRPNPGGPTVGQAVPRPNPPIHGGGGGSGGGWYPSYPYYPYYGWSFGLGYYGYYDPWWYWGAPYVSDGYGYYGADQTGRGGLKLRVEPTFAEVYVDGYYMGIVDDFDGTFQKMELEVGAHHIEIRAPGYQTIVIDVRIEFGETVTYRGELQSLSKK